MNTSAQDERYRSQHRIGRVRFEIEAPNAHSSLALRSALVSGAETWIPKALDTALEPLDTSGRTLCLDRLEVIIDGLEGKPLSSTQLIEAVREALATRIHQVRGTDTEPAYDAGDERDTLARAFAAFLESGRLPWWSPVNTVIALEANLQTLDSNSHVLLASTIAPSLVDERHARRFAIQIAPDIAAAIVAVLPSAATARIEGSSMREALKDAARAPFSAATAATIKRIQIAASVPPSTTSNAPAKQFSGPPMADPRPTRSPDVDEPFTRDPAIDLAIASTGSEPQFTRALVEPAVVIANAGLVLVHPFVAKLFAARGLTTARGFTDINAQTKGVQLLAFIASGHDEYPEPELLLAKLLCGAAAHEPVPRASRLLPGDREEAGVMLQAVIDHWGALGHASVEALRETFLHRPGRLQDTTPTWRLSVEPRGTDALLARLPWTLNAVRLPWMVRPLHVDWG